MAVLTTTSANNQQQPSILSANDSQILWQKRHGRRLQEIRFNYFLNRLHFPKVTTVTERQHEHMDFPKVTIMQRGRMDKSTGWHAWV